MPAVQTLQIAPAPDAPTLSPQQKKFNTRIRQIEQVRQKLLDWEANIATFRTAHGEILRPLQEALLAGQRRWAHALDDSGGPVKWATRRYLRRASRSMPWDICIPRFPIRFSPMTDSLRDLAVQVERFAQERDWAQFHSPKNLASALIVEAAELLEHFQWATEAESRALPEEKLAEVGAEIADVLLYLIQLSSALGIDPIAAANAKINVNAQKYPVSLSHGSSRKSTER